MSLAEAGVAPGAIGLRSIVLRLIKLAWWQFQRTDPAVY